MRDILDSCSTTFSHTNDPSFYTQHLFVDIPDFTANGQWNVRYQKAFCFVGAEVPLFFFIYVYL